MSDADAVGNSGAGGGPGIAGRALILLIRCYQKLLSPFTGNCCRFYPSCSNYWIEAIRKYGCIRGAWKGILRLAKCHPFHPGGVDPA